MYFDLSMQSFCAASVQVRSAGAAIAGVAPGRLTPPRLICERCVMPTRISMAAQNRFK